MSPLICSCCLLLAAAPATPIGRLQEAAEAYRRADFKTCAGLAAGLDRSQLKNPDVALFLEGQCRFYSGRFESARDSFARLAEQHPDSPHFTLALHRLADCLIEAGDEEQAARAYEKAVAAPEDRRTDSAVGRFHRALYALRRNRAAEGFALLDQLRIHSPMHPLLAQFPEDYAQRAITLQNSLRIAQALHDSRQWDQALAVLDEAPPPGNRAEEYLLAYRTGRILFDMRDRYPDAAAILERARQYAPGSEQSEEAWFYASRALGRMDRDQQAISGHLSLVRAYPKGRHADRALYYAGWLEQNRGECARAVPIFRRVLAEYPESRWADDASWYLAWCQIQNRQWAEAVKTLAPQVEASKSAVAGRALYWTGIAQRNLQQTRLARTAWIRTARRFPLTWYSLLAEARLGKGAPKPPRPKKADPPTRVQDPLLARARELSGAGLGELAAVLLRHGEKDFLHRRPGYDHLMALLFEYRAAGDFNRPWYLVLTRRAADLRSLPGKQNRAAWDHAYPRCERELLKKHAGEDFLFVLFLQGIMRQESGFDPLALSVAGARGLMQAYPPTARRVAGELGLEYHDQRLFEPDFNIQTAAWYIGRLRKKFRQQWPLVAGAYNAGGPAMVKWVEKNGGLPLDEFVEVIPWDESRNYIKRVIESFARYCYLEGAPPPRLNLVLNPHIQGNGIEY